MDEIQVIHAVKKKKQLAFVDDDVVLEKMHKVLRSNSKIDLEELNPKSGDFKLLVKLTRQELHYPYTSFQTPQTAKREKYLKELERATNQVDRKKIVELRKKILESHISTKERIGKFRELYTKIFNETGVPRKIVDLGAGLNAFSLPMMALSELNYIGVELNQADCDYVNQYFGMIKSKGSAIEGTAIKLDLETVTESILMTLDCDICFAFKLFDVIENTQVEKIILNLPCRYFAVTFSNQTLGKKKMSQTRRSGFQKMLRRLELEYSTFEIGNELVYIIKKKEK